MRIYEVKHCCSHIPIGKQGENNAQLIRFKIVEEWKELYGDGEFVVTHKRPADVSPYPVDLISADEKYVDWTVTAADVQYDGAGLCEIIYYVDDVVAKSATYITTTAKSETGLIPTPPDPYEAWFLRILDQIGNLDDLETLNKESLVAAINEIYRGGGGGGGAISELSEDFDLDDGYLSLVKANSVEQDNTHPITAAAVFTEVGNINALLGAI